MPPYTLWLRGRSRSAPGCWPAPGAAARASFAQGGGGPAFGQYRRAGETPWALIVLELAPAGDQITGMTSFLDTESLFPSSGSPSVRSPRRGPAFFFRHR